MDYFSKLSAQQISNIKFIIKRMGQKGITNEFTQAGILSVISKESGFIPTRERGYGNTSNAQIRKIFGSRVAKFDEGGLIALKKNEVEFFNTVYGLPKYGQTHVQGHMFRGGGLNQVTFIDAFRRLSKQLNEDKEAYPNGIDLVANPDLINDLGVATDCMILFFKNSFRAVPHAKLAVYHADNINGFTNEIDAVGAVYNANAGWGKSKEMLEPDPTGGRKLAFARVKGFLEMIRNIE